ncbi:EamA family transporter [Clostridium swellfunianum]|uniref:EamA family transporter n=1 Tax=Clostridium swellfunianum TaxID=1367462 RepID=UPI00202F4976|nr:EamA family transporter [Clostridium swellfunianum]MCM0647652.1 EamA family transporter [Clostridium swellfunianum]
MKVDIISSIKKNLKGILIIIAAALLTSIGQMLWKISNGSNLKWLILGFLCYGIGAVLMIIAFRFGSLSVLHPMLSFGYIFAIFLGNFVLKEHITSIQYLAIIIIMCGVVLIGGGDV